MQRRRRYHSHSGSLCIPLGFLYNRAAREICVPSFETPTQSSVRKITSSPVSSSLLPSILVLSCDSPFISSMYCQLVT